LLAGVFALALLVVIGRAAGPAVPRFVAWVDTLGPWGPAAYIAGYVIACIAFVPGAICTMAAGAIFGLWSGTVYAFIGETLGGIAAFLIARRIARPLVEHRFEGTPTFMTLDRAVARQGRRIVFLLRLSPLFPFNVLNYALGITGVRLVDYALASIAMLPGAFLYVYYGKVMGDLAMIASGEKAEAGAGHWLLLGVGLVATVVVTTIIARIATRELREAAAVPVAPATPESAAEPDPLRPD
jgi:uncharacterized membrane protein YdjX (TVP38/TMEM64 family)